jgi:penicillin-binding protein 2
MTDAEGNVTIVDENSRVIARARPGPNGTAILMDADGNPIDDPADIPADNPALNIRFDANGEPIFQPEVIDSVDVSREYLDIVAEGMRMVNTRIDEDSYFTGATYVDWSEFERAGIPTAGKTGTSEFCDNIAIERGWCRFEDIAQRRILPTHSWYTSYGPFDDPEIVVSVFVFNGGEGSAWAAPVACHVMAAYFRLGQYAEIMSTEPEGTAEVAGEEGVAGVEGEQAEQTEQPTVCGPTPQSTGFFPEIPPLDQLLPLIGE